ncbi:MAG: hypothetical protein WC415_01085 [Patescibacteria group bacterium]|jgi:1,4-dihydroxy-2-naphthoate octaprenyltransferase
MEKIFSVLDKKINHFIWVLVGNGIVILMLGILIVWTDFMLRLIIGLVAIMVAYMFFYGAYKVRQFRKLLDKFIKF